MHNLTSVFLVLFVFASLFFFSTFSYRLFCSVQFSLSLSLRVYFFRLDFICNHFTFCPSYVHNVFSLHTSTWTIILSRAMKDSLYPFSKLLLRVFFSGTHFGVVCNKMFRRTFDFRFQSIFIHFALMLSFPLILPKIPSPLHPSLSLDLSSFSLYLFSVRFEISLLSQSISPYQNLMVTLHAFDSLGNWTLRKTHSHTHTYTHSPLQMFTANILNGNDGIAMKIACCGRNDEMSLERRERKKHKTNHFNQFHLLTILLRVRLFVDSFIVTIFW